VASRQPASLIKRTLTLASSLAFVRVSVRLVGLIARRLSEVNQAIYFSSAHFERAGYLRARSSARIYRSLREMQSGESDSVGRSARYRAENVFRARMSF